MALSQFRIDLASFRKIQGDLTAKTNRTSNPQEYNLSAHRLLLEQLKHLTMRLKHPLNSQGLQCHSACHHHKRQLRRPLRL